MSLCPHLIFFFPSWYIIRDLRRELSYFIMCFFCFFKAQSDAGRERARRLARVHAVNPPVVPSDNLLSLRYITFIFAFVQRDLLIKGPRRGPATGDDPASNPDLLHHSQRCDPLGRTSCPQAKLPNTFIKSSSMNKSLFTVCDTFSHVTKNKK